MGNLNIKKVLQMFQRDLERNYGRNLDFEYNCDADKASVSTTLKLTKHDDDISVFMKAYPGGLVVFRAVFDKLDKTNEAIALVNDFNCKSTFFSMYADEYLAVEHCFICYEINMCKTYASMFLNRLLDLNDDEILKKLTVLTHD